MTAPMIVLEHGYLQKSGAPALPGGIQLSVSDFDALKSLLTEEPESNEPEPEDTQHHRLFRLCNVRGQEALQVRNFVGVLEVPSGRQIEILPKIGGSPGKARETLLRMLRVTRDIPAQPAYAASLQPLDLPIVDLFANEFLEAINHLIKRGIVSGYTRQRQNEGFLKGRLLLNLQFRHNLTRADRFYTEYDQFRIDRAENRLIRSALDIVAGLSRSSVNQRLCRELRFAFDDVPRSKDVHEDLGLCVKDRSLAHYSAGLMWARLILLRLTPLGRQGKARVRALLFPMERVFESYVGAGLRKHFKAPFSVREQVSRKCLVSHDGGDYFELRPDFLVEEAKNPRFVMDAKWKILDSVSGSKGKKYGISQADLYQLYAYGHKYLDNNGEKVLCLIYPMTESFSEPLAPFDYELGHRLLVLPFNLDECRLMGVDQLAA